MHRSARSEPVSQRDRLVDDNSVFHPDALRGVPPGESRGREPQGIVGPADYETVLDAARGGSRTARRSGHRRARRSATARTVDLYGGGPPESLPDLFVEMEPAGHFRPELVHPRARLTQLPPAYFRDSHHSPVGWLAAAAPSVAAGGELPPVDVLDLAPAFLALLGEPVPPELPGRHRPACSPADPVSIVTGVPSRSRCWG